MRGLLSIRRDKVVVTIIIFLTFASFAYYFQSKILPLHDTLARYLFFGFFYSHVLYFNQPPLWSPYGLMGAPTLFSQAMLLTPSMYLIGSIGYVFGIKNMLLLFKIAIFLSVVIYIGGIYLFSKHLFKHSLSRILPCLIALFSIVWYRQYDMNFNISYLLPLFLYWITLYFETLNTKYIFFLSCLVIASIMGSLIYPLIIEYYLLLFITLIIGIGQIANGKKILPAHFLKLSQISYILFFFASIAILLIYSKQYLINIAPGRDHGFSVNLFNFLYYSHISASEVIFGFISGAINNSDNTYYIGLLPLALFFLGIFIIDNPIFYGLALGVFAIFALSIGGEIATLIYKLPAMQYARQTSLYFGICDTLLILASGFVLDFMQSSKFSISEFLKKGMLLRHAFTILLITLIAIDYFGVSPYWKTPVILNDNFWQSFFSLSIIFYYRLCVYGIVGVVCIIFFTAFPKFYKLILTLGLTVAIIVDLGSYYYIHITTMPYFQEYPSPIAKANRLQYQSQRVKEENYSPAIKFLYSESNNREHLFGLSADLIYSFANTDPCYTIFRLNYVMRDIYEAVIAKGGNPLKGGPSFFGPMLDGYKKELGCYANKIRLGANDSANIIYVTQFNANKLRLTVSNTSNKSEMLTYADAYHPHWQAYVDGVASIITKNPLGFKSINIQPGKHTVIFQYGKWIDWCGSYFFIILGTLSVFLILIYIISMLFLI